MYYRWRYIQGDIDWFTISREEKLRNFTNRKKMNSTSWFVWKGQSSRGLFLVPTVLFPQSSIHHNILIEQKFMENNFQFQNEPKKAVKCYKTSSSSMIYVNIYSQNWWNLVPSANSCFSNLTKFDSVRSKVTKIALSLKKLF